MLAVPIQVNSYALKVFRVHTLVLDQPDSDPYVFIHKSPLLPSVTLLNNKRSKLRHHTEKTPQSYIYAVIPTFLGHIHKKNLENHLNATARQMLIFSFQCMKSLFKSEAKALEHLWTELDIDDAEFDIDSLRRQVNRFEKEREDLILGVVKISDFTQREIPLCFPSEPEEDQLGLF